MTALLNDTPRAGSRRRGRGSARVELPRWTPERFLAAVNATSTDDLSFFEMGEPPHKDARQALLDTKLGVWRNATGSLREMHRECIDAANGLTGNCWLGIDGLKACTYALQALSCGQALSAEHFAAVVAPAERLLGQTIRRGF